MTVNLNPSVRVLSMSDLVNKTKLIADATGALEATVNNVFGDHIAAVAIDGQSEEAVAAHFKKFEAIYKVDVGVKSMPNPYRSAKSVITNAVALGINLLDSDGLPKGKTQLQNEIKGSKEAKDANTMFRERAISLIKAAEKGDFTMTKSDFMSIMAEIMVVCPAE